MVKSQCLPNWPPAGLRTLSSRDSYSSSCSGSHFYSLDPSRPQTEKLSNSVLLANYLCTVVFILDEDKIQKIGTNLALKNKYLYSIQIKHQAIVWNTYLHLGGKFVYFLFSVGISS